MVRPMIRPPPMEARVPPRDTAPFVPGGTGLSVVIKIGGVGERMPSSEARVSPRQHAKWLSKHQYQFGCKVNDSPGDRP